MTMALDPQPRFDVATADQEEGEVEVNMMSLPTYLSQQQPNYKPNFYVEEASLYSIAEDSREGRQSEMDSVRTDSCISTSTPRSTKKKEPLSAASSPSEKGEPIPILMEWGLGMSDRGWGFNSDGDDDDPVSQHSFLGAKPNRWDRMPPTIPHLDPEELSSDYTYPMSDEPAFHKKKKCSRFKYPVVISVMVIVCLIVVLSVTLLRSNNPEQRTIATGLSTGPSFNTTRSPSGAPTARPSTSPTKAPTFPKDMDTIQEQTVYAALKSCPVNNMSQIVEPSNLWIFDELVAVVQMDQSLSQQELLERWVLVMLFVTAGGEEWYNGGAWVLPNHVCDWGSGSIVCNTRNNGDQVVTGLRLSNNHLAGSVPQELCCLSELQTLILSDNLLTGPVPKCIKNMNLTTFNISGNIGIQENP